MASKLLQGLSVSTCSYVVFLLATIAEQVTPVSGNSEEISSNESEHYQLVEWDFHHVEVPYVICLWILLASLAKIGKSYVLTFHFTARPNVDLETKIIPFSRLSNSSASSKIHLKNNQHI